MDIETIKRLLSEATPGPWGTRKQYEYMTVSTVTAVRGTYTVAERVFDCDARLIAAAPEALTFLLGELEKRDEALTSATRSLLKVEQAVETLGSSMKSSLLPTSGEVRCEVDRIVAAHFRKHPPATLAGAYESPSAHPRSQPK